MRFCWNEVQLVSQGSWFIGLGNPRVSLIVWPWQVVSLEFRRPKFHRYSELFLHSWKILPRECASLTDFHRRWISERVFVHFQFCQFLRVADSWGSGEIKDTSQKSKFWCPLWNLSQLRATILVQICLDSREILVSKQIWLKNQSSPSLKRFLGFFHIFEWIQI